MHPIIAHLIGDFLLQDDWMAREKKVSHLSCLVHVVFYLFPFWFTGIPLGGILLIGIQHFLQDRWGFIPWLMRIKGSGEFAKPPMAPWSIILTDNIIHILFILLVVRWY